MTHLKKRTYLITGAAGFIGARMVESCQERHIEVISVDELSFFESRLEHAAIDFGKKLPIDGLSAFLKTLPKIDAIIHLGAISNTREMDLMLLRERNVNASQMLWNHASQYGIPFVYASSAATYGNGEQGYSDDESKISQLHPLNPYGLSKQEFDLWALTQEKQGNHPPTWAGFKFFNVYGFGERHKGFMSSVVLHAYDQIQAQGQVSLFRSYRVGIPDGHQKRDFVYVGDIIQSLHFALERPVARGIFNLGSGQARTYLDLARLVFQTLKQPLAIQWIEMPEDLKGQYQYFTEAPMQKWTTQGFPSPLTSLEEGIQATVERLISNL